MILYAKGGFRLYRQDKHYVIMEGLYTVTGYPEPHTLDEARALVDELARCPVCHGDKVCTCRTCKGEQRLPNGIACPDCFGRGWVKCPRCGGSGVKPE